MAHAPRDYQTLRDDHAKALEALNQHIDAPETPDREQISEPSAERQSGPEAGQDPEPTRPDKMPGPSRGWTDMGGMAAQQASANQYNTLIIADLGARGQDSGQITPGATEQDAASTTLSNENDAAPEVAQDSPSSLDIAEGKELGNSGPGMKPGIDDTNETAKAWIDGKELDFSKSPGAEAAPPGPPDRDPPSHDAAASELQQHIERGESGGLKSEFREVAQEIAEPQMGPEI